MKAVTSFTLFVSLLTSPAASQPLICGTSPETQRRVDAVDRLVKRVVGCQLSVVGGCDATAAARTPTTDNQQLITPTTRFANGMFFVRADETTTPFDDPADLEGISLHFTRKSATTFAVTCGPLQYDENAGPPKEFRVLFVVLEREGQPPAHVNDYAAELEQAFDLATGGRGKVNTALSLAAPVAAFNVATNGTTATFTDTSASQPLRWEWSFGDGQTSAAKSPQHLYATAGTYQVTLTVTNEKGTSSATKTVTVGGGRKRRAVGR